MVGRSPCSRNPPCSTISHSPPLFPEPHSDCPSRRPTIHSMIREPTLGTHREQLEHRTKATCPRPFLFRPFPLLFLVMLGDLDLEGELPKRSTKNQIYLGGCPVVVEFCLTTLERHTHRSGRVTAPSPTMAGTPLDREWPELPDLRAPPMPPRKETSTRGAYKRDLLTYTQRQLEFPLALFCIRRFRVLACSRARAFAPGRSYLLPTSRGCPWRWTSFDFPVKML